ncbi:MAG: tetratricopeptide repeat protein [Dehalococcoidia bacterium]
MRLAAPVLAGLLTSLLLSLILTGLGLRDGGSSPAAVTTTAHPSAITADLVRFFESRVERDRQDFVAYNRLADAYVQRARQTGDVADYGRAEAALQASLEALPQDNYDAFVQLAVVKNATHEFEEALRLADEALAIDAGEPFAIAVRGDALVALSRYDEAQEAYQQVVAQVPGLSSFGRLAGLLELRGDLETAELMWGNALSSDSGRRPESTAWARVQLGHLRFSTGDFETADEEYGRALNAFPGYVHALAGLARVHAARGDYESAISLYDEVVARYPVPEYVAALGDVALAAGREDEAARQYELVAAIDDLYRANGVNTDLQMAQFLADHDLRPDEALRQAGAVYEERPSIQAADTLAWALYKAGRPQDALAFSDEALRLGTRDASMLFHAAMIRLELGDLDGARERLELALDINPEFSVLYAGPAAETLAQLRAAVRG